MTLERTSDEINERYTPQYYAELIVGESLRLEFTEYRSNKNGSRSVLKVPEDQDGKTQEAILNASQTYFLKSLIRCGDSVGVRSDPGIVGQVRKKIEEIALDIQGTNIIKRIHRRSTTYAEPSFVGYKFSNEVQVVDSVSV